MYVYQARIWANMRYAWAVASRNVTMCDQDKEKDGKTGAGKRDTPDITPTVAKHSPLSHNTSPERRQAEGECGQGARGPAARNGALDAGPGARGEREESVGYWGSLPLLAALKSS